MHCCVASATTRGVHPRARSCASACSHCYAIGVTRCVRARDGVAMLFSQSESHACTHNISVHCRRSRHSVSCSVTVMVACVHKCSIGGATQSASDPRGSLQPGCARRVGDASQVAGRPPSACAHITSLQMLMHHALRCGSRHCNMRASQVQAICPARVAVRGAVRAGRL